MPEPAQTSWLPKFLQFGSTPAQDAPTGRAPQPKPSAGTHSAGSNHSWMTSIIAGVSTEPPGLGTSESEPESDDSSVSKQWKSLLEHIKDGRSWAVDEGEEDVVVAGLVDMSEATKTTNSVPKPKESVNEGAVEIVPCQTHSSSSSSSHESNPSIRPNPPSPPISSSITSRSESVKEYPRPEIPKEPLGPMVGFGSTPVDRSGLMPGILKSPDSATKVKKAVKWAVKTKPPQGSSSSSASSGHSGPGTRPDLISPSSIPQDPEYIRRLERIKSSMEKLGPMIGIESFADVVEIPEKTVDCGAVEATPSQTRLSSPSSQSDTGTPSDPPSPPTSSSSSDTADPVDRYERAEPPREPLGPMIGFGPLRESQQPLYGFGPVGGFGPLDTFEPRNPFPPPDALRSSSSSIHLTFPHPAAPPPLEKPDYRFPVDMPPPYPEPQSITPSTGYSQPWKKRDPRGHCPRPVVRIWGEEVEGSWREEEPGRIMTRRRTRLVYG